jgi:hypothetical protein
MQIKLPSKDKLIDFKIFKEFMNKINSKVIKTIEFFKDKEF